MVSNLDMSLLGENTWRGIYSSNAHSRDDCC